MANRARRPAAERAAAEVRLSSEVCVPVAELAGTPLVLDGQRQEPSAIVLLRWGEGKVRGGRRVYLDMMLCPHRLTYVTSRAALARFAAEVEAATSGASAAKSPSPADTP